MAKLDEETNKLINQLIPDQESDGSWSYPFETGVSTEGYMIILL